VKDCYLRSLADLGEKKTQNRSMKIPIQRFAPRQRPFLITRRCLSWKSDHPTGILSYKKEPLYQTIIGLEVHAQLSIATKLFSPASTSSGPPNTRAHPLDLAVPGSLPTISQSAVQSAVLAAAALQCQISTTSRFERKHYAYADLPAGYQITQQRWPLAQNGMLSCQYGKKKKELSCRINRIQLEQDTGKTAMTINGNNGTGLSRVDFNRAGCALIEIVTEPDLRSSEQAAAAMETIRQLLKHVGVCDGRMEQGSLRCDLNVNLQRISNDDTQHQERSPRVEVKNLNSIKQVQDAANYEVLRQAKAWMDDEELSAETRTWNVASNKTVLIRRKDDEQDYRFLPEPDLPPLILDESVFGGVAVQAFLDENLPELPGAAVERMVQSYGLSDYQANVIASDPPAIHLFDNAVKAALDELGETFAVAKKVADYTAKLLSNELFALVKENALEESEASVHDSTVDGEQLAEIVVMLTKETISSTMAKKLLRILFEEENLRGARPRQVAADHGFELITDTHELRKVCETVVAKQPEMLDIYRKGGRHVTKMLKHFTGQAMAASHGNAHPERLREVLTTVLEEQARK